MSTSPVTPAQASFNLMQLASYIEARSLRDLINNSQYFIANNNLILPGDDEAAPDPVPNANMPWLPPVAPPYGIFLPNWGNTGGPEPSDDQGRLWLHFRMQNGGAFNVGLWIDKFKRYPNAPDYVLRNLADETMR